MARWQNGKMASWQNGKLAKWRSTIQPAKHIICGVIQMGQQACLFYGHIFFFFSWRVIINLHLQLQQILMGKKVLLDMLTNDASSQL
jgi:hypothetical protein